MNKNSINDPSGTACKNCPLAELPRFRTVNQSELSFLQRFKSGELRVETGATLLMEGAQSVHFYTILSGWAFRYKMLEDGRRQILNYAVTGDLLGLQAGLMREMAHSVEALSRLTVCVFERDRLKELFTNHPGLSYDITWIASREERILDEHLLSVGRRTALERAAYLMVHIFRRAKAVGLIGSRRPIIPITQQHVADTLGLSLVHTNKTLRKLADSQLLRWSDGGCEVLRADELADIAGWDGGEEEERPYL